MTSTICFFSGDITRDGGTEKAAALVAGQLAKSMPEDFRVIILSMVLQNRQPFFDIDGSIECFNLTGKSEWIKPGPGYLPLIKKLNRFLREQKVDVIIDIDSVLDVLSVPAAKKLNVKIISWAHFNFSHEMQGGYRRCIVKHITPKTDCLVALTEQDAKKYRELYGDGFEVAEISNPVLINQNVIPYNDRDRTILTVGHLSADKGMEMLTRIAVRILKKYSDWKWVVCGEGKYRATLEEVAAGNGLLERFIAAGRVSDISERFSHARIFSSMSRSEGMPMSMLEAKAAGAVCISFDVSDGVRALIKDNENGCLVSPFDEEEYFNRLCLLIEDKERAAGLSKASSDGLYEFELEYVTYNKWIPLLKRIINEQKET